MPPLSLPKTQCIVCKEQSIEPIKRRTIFGAGFGGIKCGNKQCPMYHVTIPWQMVFYTKDVPEEYLPPGFYVK